MQPTLLLEGSLSIGADILFMLNNCYRNFISPALEPVNRIRTSRLSQISAVASTLLVTTFLLL